MTAAPTVTYETRDRKAYLTLDRPERLNAIDDVMPARDPGGGRAGERRRRRPGDRAAGQRAGLLRRLRPQAVRRGRRGLALEPAARLGPGARLPRDEAQHRRLLHAVALAEADDLQGAGVRDRGRQRHRPVVRPARDGRRRAHRLPAGPGLGLPDHRDVGLPAGRAAGQADAAHRRHRRREDGRRVGARARVRAGRPARRAGRGARRPDGDGADQPARHAEAHGQPGVRQHGAVRHAGARDALRRDHPALGRRGAGSATSPSATASTPRWRGATPAGSSPTAAGRCPTPTPALRPADPRS